MKIRKKSYFIFFELSPFADLDFEVLFEKLDTAIL